MASVAMAFDILARKDTLSPALKKAGDESEKTGGKLGKLGGAAKIGLLGVATAAAGAAVGIGAFGVESVRSLGRIERINAQTETAIKSMGGAANVSAADVESLAGELERLTASEAETVQEGANLLLTFGNIRNEAGAGNDVFDQTTRLMVDMSRAMGTEANDSAIQLGKALNDPVKGITALTRVGVSFTDEQKNLIESLTESGDIMGAQKVILQELENQFGGSGEAFAATTEGQIEQAKHAIGTLGETLTEGLLPIVGDIAQASADWLNAFAEDFAAGEGRAGQFRDTLVTVKDGAQQLFDIVFRGDFTGGPLSEDSKTVDVLFNLRDGFIETRDTAQQMFDVLFRGDFTGGPLDEDSKVVSGLFAIRDGALVVRDFFRDEIGPRLAIFGDYLRNDLGPDLVDLRDRFNEDVLPKLRELAEYLVVTFQPTWDALVDLYNDDLKPAIDQIRQAFKDNEPQMKIAKETMERVAVAVGVVAGAVFYLWTQYLSHLLPALVQVIGYLIGKYADGVEKTQNAMSTFIDIVVDLRDKFVDAKDNISDFIDGLKDIDVPEPLKRIAEIIEKIGNGVGGVAGRVRDAVGDVAGSFRGTAIGGGPALARVRSILPAGLRITSTYRDPAHNARVGGSPTSKHMDRNNPAVDIAGPVGLMDSFAQQLAAMGGWRQLLYRVAGHYDHIHVADQGGVFQGPGYVYMGAGQETFASGIQAAKKVGDLPAGSGEPLSVRVFIGDRELTDIVRVEVDNGMTDVASMVGRVPVNG